MEDVRLHPRFHAHAARVRPIISDYADELLAAERGKPSARVGRKQQAKDAAVKQIVALILRSIEVAAK